MLPLYRLYISFLYHRMLEAIDDYGVATVIPPAGFSLWDHYGYSLDLGLDCILKPRTNTITNPYEVEYYDAGYTYIEKYLLNQIINALSNGFTEITVGTFVFIADGDSFNINGTELYVSPDIVYRLACIYLSTMLTNTAPDPLCSKLDRQKLNISTPWCVALSDSTSIVLSLPAKTGDLVSSGLRTNRVNVKDVIDLVATIYGRFEDFIDLIVANIEYTGEHLYYIWIDIGCRALYANGRWVELNYPTEELMKKLILPHLIPYYG